MALSLIGSPVRAQSAPTISPLTGSFTTTQTVTITGSGGSIFYTLNGEVPTNASNAYSAPFTVDEPTHVRAVVYSAPNYSPITDVYLDIDPSLSPILQSSLILRLRAGLGVVASGSPTYVSKWYDLSGLANDATGTSGSQPTFLNSAQNFLPSVKFDGASQYLTLPSLSTTFSGVTMFAVVQPSAITGGARVIDLGSGASANNLLMRISSSGSLGEFWSYNGTSGTSVQSPSTLAVNRADLIEGVQSGTSATFFQNGNAGSTNSSMSTIPSATRSNCFIGQASAGGNYYPGRIAEVLVYSNNLSASTRSAIQSFLIQKYQLLSTTPSAPIISLPGGTLAKPSQVVIASDPGTTTFITTDGTSPSTSSVLYDGCPITILYSMTLKAISYKSGVASGISSETYTLDPGLWPAPSSSDPATPSINIQLPAPSI